MKKTFIVAIISFLGICVHAQVLFFTDYSEAQLVYFECSFRQDISGNMQAHSKGGGFEIGINIAEKINNRMSLVPYVGMAFTAGAETRNEFLIDFNRYYNENAKNDAVIDNFKNYGYSGGDDSGNTVHLSTGLLFRPPGKFSPTITLYGKIMFTSMDLPASSGWSDYESGSNISKLGMGGEFRFPISRSFYAGIYYDLNNFRKAKTTSPVGEDNMEDYVDEALFEKYGNREKIFGFKIGYNFLLKKHNL